VRKSLILVALFAVVFALALASGCGNSTTIKTPEGTAEVQDDGSKVTFNNGDESWSTEQSATAPSETELGAPIYPGSEYNTENSGSVDYSNQGAGGSSLTAEFTTSDGYSKVIDWYQGRLGAPGSSDSSISQWTVGDLVSGVYTIVQVEAGSPTRITITHMEVSVK
jgi:hypothetical protein